MTFVSSYILNVFLSYKKSVSSMILIPLSYTGTFSYIRNYHPYYCLQFNLLRSLIIFYTLCFKEQEQFQNFSIPECNNINNVQHYKISPWCWQF